MAIRAEVAMIWKSPHWLWLLIAVPLMLGLLTVWGRDRHRARAQYADPAVLDISPSRRVSGLRAVALGAAALAAVAGILAMARPAVSREGTEKRSTVMLAIDTSKSMLSEDLTPNRLQAGVDAAKRFIQSGQPFLGICVGYQALFERSEEFNSCAAGLGIFKGSVVMCRA